MSDPDAGFCSGEEELEGEAEVDDDLHSPTDVSQDSVEVQVLPIRLQNTTNKNKRKCAEPRKLSSDDPPLKKTKLSLSSPLSSPSPFRPWSLTAAKPVPQETSPSNLSLYMTEQGWLHNHPRLQPSPEYQSKPPPLPQIPLYTLQEEQEQPLALVLRPSQPKEAASIDKRDKDPGDTKSSKKQDISKPSSNKQLSPKDSCTSDSKNKTIRTKKCATSPRFTVDSLLNGEGSSSSSTNQTHLLPPPQQPRNYKNMTRERRIEANARERTRVHTISAAFDTLRRAVPSYSNTQKLSKLSVLRIACAYMMMLSQLLGENLSPHEGQMTLASCVDQIAHTIQNEGKLRKRKDE